jgi:hypothetical protein
MASENLFTLFPQRKIRAYDGMPVTAEIWDEAHTYHDRAQRAHNLFFHGAGILVGMEVVASDPPDQMVYILPGAAVDPTGQLIVLPEPVAYDLGSATDGALYLFISYRKSITGRRSPEAAPTPEYTDDQFLIAAAPSLPEQPVVELARFRRDNRGAPIRDAHYPLHPHGGEIDLRFRRLIPVRAEPQVSAAVVYLGEGPEKDLGAGLARLTGELHQVAQINLVVDDDLQLGPEVLGYALICLAAQGSFQLTPAQVKGLRGYLERGGSLFLEYADEAASACFSEVCAGLGAAPQALSRGHPLLAQPFLFSAPPPGFADGQLLAADGLLLSGSQYGKAWCGESPAQAQTREQTRALVEWAANLLAYAADRRSAGPGAPVEAQ